MASQVRFAVVPLLGVAVLSFLAACRVDEPAAPAMGCAAEAHQELATLCFVEEAAAAGRQRDEAAARASCEQVPAGTWRQECLYRMAEGLGEAGAVAPAMRACADSADFADMCVVHVAWVRSPGWQALAEPGRLDVLLSELGAGAPDSAAEQLLAAAWFDHSLGRGTLDLEGARRASGRAAVAARSAIAFEATRLLLADGVAPAAIPAEVLAVWEGQRPPPTGATLARDQRRFRLHGAVRDQDAVPVFLDTTRLSSRDAQADLLIATLEALFMLGVEDDVYASFATDRRRPVRHTAVRLAALSGRHPPAEQLDTDGARLVADALREPARDWRAPP